MVQHLPDKQTVVTNTVNKGLILNKKCCFLSAFVLVACVAEPPPPSHVKLAETPTTSQLGSAVMYRCEEGKEIRVVRTVKKSKTAKTTKSIQLTFNNVTEKLISTVSEKGKKYTNIHWQWLEQGEDARLTTSVGAVLAEKCIRQ